MLVGSKQNLEKSAHFHFKIGDLRKQPSERVKVLGVTIDAGLTWAAHITSVVQKCNRILVTLYKFQNYFTSDAIQIIIQAYIFPHITYCLSVWAAATKGQLHKIQKVINFAARLATGLKKYDHITPALKSLNWPTIETLVMRRDLVKVYKCLMYDDTPEEIRGMFTRRSDVSERQTRASQRGDLHVTKCKLSATQRVFSQHAALSWSSLPSSVRSEPTVNTFRAALQDMPFS